MCGESAGSSSAGVVLDSIVKLAIFSLETTLEATDSGSRLQSEVDLLEVGLNS